MIRPLILLLFLPVSAALSQQADSSASRQAIEVKAAKPEYSQQAKISSRAAADSALARVPGGRIAEAELEKEKGHLVYSFDIQAPKKTGVDEVLVDAALGSSPLGEARVA